MTTGSPPVAIKVRADLDRLHVEALRLWDTEPEVDGELRQELLTELADIDLELERLSLRAHEHADDGYLPDVDRCARRLDHLTNSWPSAA
jgi:hypothetical protein